MAGMNAFAALASPPDPDRCPFQQADCPDYHKGDAYSDHIRLSDIDYSVQ
ncbi:hypothetical protein J23TS9_07780 [Paenibacillus sp. J23TS9]|nr:hypothetical protein J23TS9_07780 [Paenibacillus sp. J23TS9]